jgi:crotonobetainyl-CoA:carnitine CoA-transferase CaiB-like acyl-CoA transferase
MMLTLAHPVHGQIKTTGLGVKLSRTPGNIKRPPLLGEHTDEVLIAHGYTRDEINKLRDTGAIGPVNR